MFETAFPRVKTNYNSRDSEFATLDDRIALDSGEKAEMFRAHNRVLSRKGKAAKMGVQEQLRRSTARSQDLWICSGRQCELSMRPAIRRRHGSTRYRQRQAERPITPARLNTPEYLVLLPQSPSRQILSPSSSNINLRIHATWKRRPSKKPQASKVSHTEKKVPRLEVPRSPLEVQRASNLALSAAGYQAPSWLRQTPDSSKASKAKRFSASTSQEQAKLDSFASLLEADLLATAQKAKQPSMKRLEPPADAHSSPSAHL